MLIPDIEGYIVETQRRNQVDQRGSRALAATLSYGTLPSYY